MARRVSLHIQCFRAEDEPRFGNSIFLHQISGNQFNATRAFGKCPGDDFLIVVMMLSLVVQVATETGICVWDGLPGQSFQLPRSGQSVVPRESSA